VIRIGALQTLGIELRQVHEVNIHVNSPERAADARELLAREGIAYSVFGRRHNDDIWLELYESAKQGWIASKSNEKLEAPVEKALTVDRV
jgi:hypothetical protein